MCSSDLVLGKDKGYLIESRLLPIARKHGLRDLGELAAALRGPRRDALTPDVVDAITTNESFFFRDGKPFDSFKNKVLPELLERRAATRQINIWCAAASTGQEPYSLAMILREEAAKLAGWQCQIIGTDISPTALDRAKAGLYTQFEVQRGLSIQRLMTHFEKKGEMWQIKSDLQGRVQYRLLNLLGNIKMPIKFDVVYCRNVLIYFDQATKGRVLASIASVMRDDGTLFLGGAETVFGITEAFRPIIGQQGMYTVVPKAGRPAAPSAPIKSPGAPAGAPPATPPGLRALG